MRWLIVFILASIVFSALLPHLRRFGIRTLAEEDECETIPVEHALESHVIAIRQAAQKVPGTIEVVAGIGMVPKGTRMVARVEHGETVAGAGLTHWVGGRPELPHHHRVPAVSLESKRQTQQI